MEVILLQMFDPIINWGMSSFNPCFYGSYSFTVEYKGTPFKDIANLKIELNTSHVTVKLPVIYTFLIYII